MIRAVWMLLFWIVAAVLVSALPQMLDAPGPFAAAGVKAAVIAAVAFGYVRVCGGPASLDGALMVGALWLLLDVIAEIAVTTLLSHSWFELIGSPSAPLLRTCLMLAWITAPALFVRHRDTTPAQ